MRFDRYGRREAWTQARAAESSYNTKLRQVAKQTGDLVKGLAPGGFVKNLNLLLRTLQGYSELLTPWAEATAAYMVADVARRDARAWRAVSRDMGVAIRGEVATSPQGLMFRRMTDEQVPLIKSIPLDAAARVSQLAQGTLYSSARPEQIAKEIQRQGAVSINKARLIARTEVSRTAANFMQARAVAAGSEGYIWRTSKDADVRDTHKVMEGKYVRWDTPPKTDPSLDPYHAGCGPNCRCFAEPVLPDL